MKTPDSPKIIAHRGHLTDLPENAVGSIKKVLQLGLLIKKTSDSSYVVLDTLWDFRPKDDK